MTERRTPRSLDEAYLYATEVNLATLDEIWMLGSSSNARKGRQRGICLGMLEICQSTMVSKEPSLWGSDLHPHFSRVQRYLEAAKSHPEGLEGALDAQLQRLDDLRRKTHIKIDSRSR